MIIDVSGLGFSNNGSHRLKAQWYDFYVKSQPKVNAINSIRIAALMHDPILEGRPKSKFEKYWPESQYWIFDRTHF
jgi:hypothetical protein